MSIAASNTSMRVPAGFRNLLEGLTREVLREQPTDVVAFAAQYFQKLLESREGEWPCPAGTPSLPALPTLHYLPNLSHLPVTRVSGLPHMSLAQRVSRAPPCPPSTA